jgi:sulfur-oxidizing protein SoxA
MLRVPLLVLAALLAAPTARPAEPPRPNPLKGGVEFQSADVRALQGDDFANPMTLWVTRGEALWAQPRGTQGKACASCHGEAKVAMKGIAAHYPRHDAGLGRVVNLEERIQACSERNQGAGRFANESDDLVGIASYVALQSRGTPLAVSIDGPRSRPTTPAASSTSSASASSTSRARIATTRTGAARCSPRASARATRPVGPRIASNGSAPARSAAAWRACFNGVRAEMPAYGPRTSSRSSSTSTSARGARPRAPGVRR